MKKINLGFSVLVTSVVLLASCNKKITEAPVADAETQSAVEATYANAIVTDIDMICGFLGENASPRFVANLPGSVPPSVTINTVSPQSASITFNNTRCYDGKTRNGSIVMTYSFTNINSSYYRDYGFIGKVTLNNYVVDGWMVDDSTVFTIKNLATSPNPNPAVNKLRWSLEGNFNMKNVADPTKRMTWVGNLNKTLANTAQLAPNNLTAITWSLGVIEYEGSFKGVTPGNVAYTYTVGTEKPLVRNYTCSSDKVIGVVTTPSISAINSEYHPFINGVASFTTAAKEPRVIDFGTEGAACDNNGTVTIKGITYKVDFIK